MSDEKKRTLFLIVFSIGFLSILRLFVFLKDEFRLFSDIFNIFMGAMVRYAPSIITIGIVILIFKLIFRKDVKNISTIKKDFYKNDINKVADKILFYQNNNINDIDIIINNLKKEHKDRNTWVGWQFNWKHKNRFFYLPNDMKITKENNEIIIYYKNFIYNVNKGKYV